MSRRSSIVKALTETLKQIDGTGGFNVNLFNNSFDKIKFWDEVSDFPCIYATAGQETREYHASGFAWGFLNICIKIYTKGEEPSMELEGLLEDVEAVVDSLNGELVYDTTNNYRTAQLSITSITTDEGLLTPYGVGEINLLVRYQVM